MNNPKESQEQQALFEWASMSRGLYPELECMFAIPNGGSRHIAEAAKFKREGVKAGVSDIFLSVARQGYHGLYIEMKRKKGGTVSKEQKEWIAGAIEQGYKAVVCNGFDEAREVIKEYLR